MPASSSQYWMEQLLVSRGCVWYVLSRVLSRGSVSVDTVHFPRPDPGDFSVGGPYYELTFNPYNANEDLCVTIPINEDEIYEDSEVFIALLTTNDSCVDFKQDQSTVEILDNDCEWTLSSLLD